MTITLSIDRIVLNGVPVEARHLADLRAAIAAELTTLLGQSAPPRRAARQRTVEGAAIVSAAQPATLGRRIAGSVAAAVRAPAGRGDIGQRR
jgi:hypothetical protein